MEPILKRSLVGMVVTELRERLAAGKFKEGLPSVRLLSRLLGVSVPTVCRALHILAEDGLLESGGMKRRWRVKSGGTGPGAGGFFQENRSHVTAGKKPQTGRLLFLASQSLSSERHSGVEVLAELLDQLGTKGWEMMHRVQNFASAKKPRRSWDELLELAQPDAMVVLGGTPVMAKWALERKIRTLFLGGDGASYGVPMLSVSIATVLRQTLGHLLATGHQRILFPLCARSDRFIEKCRETAVEATITAGVNPKATVIAETPYAGPEVMVDLLRRQWVQNAPDALILLDWREFVAASSYFKQTGIVIPRDV